MRRRDLEHLIRAAGDIADDDEVVVIGSQAILGKHPDAPRSLRVSVEADLYPKNHPGRADVIDGAIGELSATPRAWARRPRSCPRAGRSG